MTRPCVLDEQRVRPGGPRAPYDDPIELFYQDVPHELAVEALSNGRDQSEARLDEPWPLDAWPNVPTRVLLCRDDRIFPAGFVRRVARERLGLTPDEIDGGHCPALSRPGRSPPARGVRGGRFDLTPSCTDEAVTRCR